MRYLKKKVFRGENRSEDVYFSLTCIDNIYRLKIGSETPLTEEELMAYLKLYLDEWVKSVGLLSIEDLNMNSKQVN